MQANAPPPKKKRLLSYINTAGWLGSIDLHFNSKSACHENQRQNRAWLGRFDKAIGRAGPSHKASYFKNLVSGQHTKNSTKKSFIHVFGKVC